MITSNVFLRVFQIKYNNSTGTIFTMEVDNKQYLVTARHIVKQILGKDKIEIFHDNIWKTIDVELVGHSKNNIDISVLTTNFQVSKSFPLEPSGAGLMLGQDTYFLGFPYGMFNTLPPFNKDFHLAFVKKAILSCIQTNNLNETVVFLDGHNNPGFSGGPVVFTEYGKKDFKISSVISGYRFNVEPVYEKDNISNLYYKENTGIIVSYDIKHAVDLIKNNPIGFSVVV